MRIARIHIENFRALKLFDLTPRPGINVLIGENNTGKSCLLHALDRALGRGAPMFDLQDFFAVAPRSDPAALSTIRIDLEIRPAPAVDFSTAFTSEFVDDIDFDGEGQPFLCYRTEASLDAKDGRVRVDYFAVKADGSARSMPVRRRIALRGYIPFYLTDASRDTIQELRSRRGFWARLVDSLVLDPATATAVAQALEAINSSILNATPRLAEIRARFQDLGTVIPAAPDPGAIVVNPVPADAGAILRNLEIVLQTLDSSRGFTLDRHGEGTRSVGYLIIFRAFVDLLAREENDNAESEPVLGVEEPEAHLHPHARRAIATWLGTLNHQLFVTTHSTAVTRHVEVPGITLLRRLGTGCIASQVPTEDPRNPGQPYLAPRKRAILDRELRSGAAEALFARSVLLFEGESEVRALPIFAKALKIDLHLLGMSLVSVDGTAYEPLVRILDVGALGIPWVILSDGEQLDKLAALLVSGGRVVQTAVDAAVKAGRLHEDILLPNDCFALDHGLDFEGVLIHGGARQEYENAIVSNPEARPLASFVGADPKRAALTPEEQMHAYMKESRWGGRWKVLFAATVAQEITKGGTDPARIPAPIVAALLRARDFATGVAKKV